jgi:hypothetical protein
VRQHEERLRLAAGIARMLGRITTAYIPNRVDCPKAIKASPVRIFTSGVP